MCVANAQVPSLWRPHFIACAGPTYSADSFVGPPGSILFSGRYEYRGLEFLEKDESLSEADRLNGIQRITNASIRYAAVGLNLRNGTVRDWQPGASLGPIRIINRNAQKTYQVPPGGYIENIRASTCTGPNTTSGSAQIASTVSAGAQRRSLSAPGYRVLSSSGDGEPIISWGAEHAGGISVPPDLDAALRWTVPLFVVLRRNQFSLKWGLRAVAGRCARLPGTERADLAMLGAVGDSHMIVTAVSNLHGYTVTAFNVGHAARDEKNGSVPRGVSAGRGVARPKSPPHVHDCNFRVGP